MTVLITGASSGFGREAVKIFIENGYHVIGLARRQDRLQVLKEELGDHFHPLCLDITDHKAVKQGIVSLPKEFADISILINNAGLALGLETADKANFSDWQQMIDVNITGLAYITSLILPKMVEKNDGYIINLSSVAGSYPYYGGNVYGASKAFVTQFSLNLRADLIGKNIRVTSVEPGLCSETEFSNVRFKGDDEKAVNLYKDVEAITGRDVAKTLYWLATQPKHININRIEMMPTAQTFAGLKVYKEK